MQVPLSAPHEPEESHAKTSVSHANNSERMRAPVQERGRRYGPMRDGELTFAMIFLRARRLWRVLRALTPLKNLFCVVHKSECFE